MPHTDTLHNDPRAPEPSLTILLLLAVQHVLVLFSGIILVPVMLVNIYGIDSEKALYFISSTTLMAAVATLFQLFKKRRFGLGAPMFMGTSGAFLTCTHSAFELGGGALFAGMLLLSAPFQLIFSYSLRFMRHILTPTVGGVIIMLAMVGLLRDAVHTWISPSLTQGWSAQMDIITGMGTAVVMLGVEWFGGRRYRPWSLPCGILAGCCISLLADLSFLPDVSSYAWFGFSLDEWPGIEISLAQPEHWTLLLTFILATFATSVKFAGDTMMLQKVVSPERKHINYDALQGGLYANGVSMLLTGFMCGMPSSSHSANIPLMELTGVATRRLAALTALLLILISFSPKMVHLLINLPAPVVGGVGVVLVAHLFSAGMQLVSSEMNHRNGLIAGLSLCAGLIAVRGDFFPNAFPTYLGPLTHNGVALGGLVAILLTLLTRFSVERGHDIQVQPTESDLHLFKKRLAKATNRLKLSANTDKYLELACEEVFLYMCEQCRQKGYTGTLRFNFRPCANGILVEASGGTKFSSRADELAAHELHGNSTLTDDSLKDLGLVLLGHIATNINHVTIAGYTYIGFVLPHKD